MYKDSIERLQNGKKNIRKQGMLWLAMGVFLAGSFLSADDYFDWREFGAREVQKAPQNPVARARFIVAQVGRELTRQGIRPNTSYLGRARSFATHSDQSLGTCNDLAVVIRDALGGAGFDEKALHTVVTSKRGLSRLNRGWLFDVNLDHAVPVLLIDGKAYTFDLWAHGGLRGNFDYFDSSIWCGLELRNWGRTMENYGYSEYCVDKGSRSEFISRDMNRIIRDLLLRSNQAKKPAGQPVSPASGSAGEETIVREYRAVYPAYLQAFHKGKRVQMIANAVKVGTDRYRCANKVFDIIRDGPRKGEVYCCSSFDRIVPLSNLRQGLAQMKQFLGRK